MTAFRFLVQMMTAVNDDWPAVVGNIQRERKRWGQLSRIFEPVGGRSEGVRAFFKALTQAVLLLGA